MARVRRCRFQIRARRGTALRVHSQDDRIDGFTTAIHATGARRFFAAPLAGPSEGNSIDLELLGTTIVTPACGGADFVADIQLSGAFTADESTIPGEGNTLRAVIRGVTGSGVRSNFYTDVLGPNGPLPGVAGNRLEIVGNSNAFGKTNSAIDPAPGAQFFTGGGQ